MRQPIGERSLDVGNMRSVQMVRTVNFLLYQIGWFACVFGAAYARPWLGTTIGAVLVGIHLCWTTDWPNQLKAVAFAVALGLLVDTALLHGGVYRFPAGVVVTWLPPPWMSVLWMQFAMTLQYSLKWLSGRYTLAALLGLVGAPLAFLAGEKLGAISFLSPRATNIAVLGALWGVAIPVLIWVSDHIHSHSKLPLGYRGLEG